MVAWEVEASCTTLFTRGQAERQIRALAPEPTPRTERGDLARILSRIADFALRARIFQERRDRAPISFFDASTHGGGDRQIDPDEITGEEPDSEQVCAGQQLE